MERLAVLANSAVNLEMKDTAETLTPFSSSSSALKPSSLSGSSSCSGLAAANNNSNNNASTTSSSTSSDPSSSSSSSSAKPPPVDWSRLVTIEERNFIRNKIKAAYTRQCPTYEELLLCCSSIEEEYAYLTANSRLDYFKSGVQYEKRVAEKLRSKDGTTQSSALSQAVREAGDETTTVQTLKRAKTQH